MLFLLVIASCVADDRFDRYNESSFNQGLASDVESVISGFYSDLSLTIADLIQDTAEIALPYHSTRPDNYKTVFRYTSPRPLQYHLKRNHSLALRAASDFKVTLEPKGDCSMVYTYKQYPTQLPQVVNELKSSHGTIQVEPNRNVPSYLFVPDSCVLYLKHLEVEAQLDLKTQIQVQFSHRNNRPPELIGLQSRVYNLNRFEYLDYLVAFPSLSMTEYTETTAEFAATIDDTYVVPQASSLLLFERDLSTQDWEQDTVTMRFRRSNLETCDIEMHREQGLSVQEMDADGVFEIEIEKHVLKLSRQVFRLPVPPDCELTLLHVTRSLGFASNSRLVKQMRYGMTETIAQGTSLGWNEDRIISSISRINYMDSISDFPALGFSLTSSAFWFGTSTFQVSPLRTYAIPPETRVILHSTTSSATFTQDFVTLLFTMETEECQVKTWIQSDGEDLNTYSRAFEITTPSTNKVQVYYQLHRLNAGFAEGTKFFLESSCTLVLNEAKRVVNGRPERRGHIIPSIRLESELISYPCWF